MKKKPDPIQLGEELALYLQKRKKRANESGLFNFFPGEDAPYSFFELLWEKQFWEAKALGLSTEVVELPKSQS